MDHLSVLERIKISLDQKNSFVVHGGAGSGKTQILKQTIEYLASKGLDDNLLCITHTNVAADEIKNRVDFGKYKVSTIHSFLNDICSGYTRNIKLLLHQYFSVDLFEEIKFNQFDDEKSFKLARHDRYKKCHKDLASATYGLSEELLYLVVGKREFDKNANHHIENLNEKITLFNMKLISYFEAVDISKIGYNESIFDNIKHGTYGHDGLLEIATLLFSRYDKLHKILSDKYSFILIDEYQDSNEDVVNFLFDLNYPITIGLFGDSMQGIYENTIGDAKYLCKSGKLKEIIKSDNYRCSVQVTNFINNLRVDGLVQEVKLKSNDLDISNRQGNVKLYYSMYDKAKPYSNSNVELKDEYLLSLENIISTVRNHYPDYKILLLTNKMVAKNVGFFGLFNTFSNRYMDVSEKLEKFCTNTNLMALCEILNDYYNNRYNHVIGKLRKNGYAINTVDDKIKIKSVFADLQDDKISLWKAIEYAIDKKLISKSKYLDLFKLSNEELINELKTDLFFIEFCKNFEDGYNTYKRLSEVMVINDESQFKKNLSNYKRKIFYESLRSEKLGFIEVKNYFDYLNEKTSFITMHKTKGTSIDNVIVIGDNFFWNKYQFDSVYHEDIDKLDDKSLASRKLFYVACSRCVSNLIVIHLFDKEQKDEVFNKFDEIVIV